VRLAPRHFHEPAITDYVHNRLTSPIDKRLEKLSLLSSPTLDTQCTLHSAPNRYNHLMSGSALG